LPATLTSLRIDNQPNLEEVVIEGYDQLAEVYVDARRAGTLNTQTIALNIYNAAKVYDEAHQGEPPRQVITTFLNVNWSSFDINAFMWFTKQKSSRLTGRIAIYEASAYQNAVNFNYKLEIIKKWGDVDFADSDAHKGLLLVYNKSYWVSGNITGSFYNDGNNQIPFSIESSGNYLANNISNVVWSIKTEPIYAKVVINEVTGVLTIDLSTLSTIEDFITVKAVVTIFDADGVASDVELERTIKLYNRQAQLGDLVMYDGTYCDPDDYDGVKSVVGVCFFIAPVDANGEIRYRGDGRGATDPSKFKQLRLMMSCSYMKVGTNEFNKWGAYPGTAAADSLYIPVVNENGTTVNTQLSLKSTSNGQEILNTTTFYDIPTIANINKRVAYNFSTSAYLDTSSEEGLANAGFKVIAQTYTEGDGFSSDEETASEIEARTLTEELALLAGNDYKAGDIVNSGYAKTLKIIQHRNLILNNRIHPIETNDFSLNTPIPQASSDGLYSELESLYRLMQDIKTQMKENLGENNYTKWETLYFPAASACYAYEPSVKIGENLADKFKAHNWFMPTCGHALRIYVYTKKYLANIFEKAINLGVMYKYTITSYSYQPTTTESTNNAYAVIFDNGQITSSDKKNTFNGMKNFALCAF
jgi:hypothetical protein